MEVVMRRGRGRPPKERKPCTCRFFKIILPPTLDQNSLKIPQKFAKTFIPQVSVATLRVPTGLSWKVAISRSNNQLHFTQGWKEFMDHNSIKFGYFLEFEYKKNCHFDVHIFDFSCCEIDYPRTIPKCPTDHDHVLANQFPIECPVQVNEEEEREGKEIHNRRPGMVGVESESGNPSFTIVLQKYQCSGNALYIQRSFLRQHVPGKLRKFVKLLTEDGREWNLRCHSTNHSTRLIGFGCAEFRQEYKLDIGDICMFELVGADHDSITLKASKEIGLALLDRCVLAF